MKKVQDYGQDDDKKEKHVSVNQRFRLVELKTGAKKQVDGNKFTQVVITRVSPNNYYFIIRLARNLNQCLHVDFSEKKKMNDDTGADDDDDEKKGFNMGVFQENKPKEDKEKKDDIIPHKIQ